MTITASNYAAHAQRAMHERLPRMRASRNPDAASIENLAGLIGEAQHFALPDNAELFDDGLRGLAGLQARLPYPVITLEYFVKPDTLRHVEASLYAPRVLIVAIECPPKTISLQETNPAILIFSMYFIEGGWVPHPAGFLLSSNWDDCKDATKIRTLVEPRSDVPPMVGRVVPLMPNAVREMGRARGTEWVERELSHNISREVYAVLAFCEALACSNVSTAVIGGASAAVNAKRVRAGKLPMLETKVLTVQVPGQQTSRVGGSRQTGEIRQHLRRGHIRRIAENRRVWVNSCVVGNPERGSLEKSYRIDAAAQTGCIA